MIKLWKDIKGFEGWYQISNLGNVKSLDRYITMKRGNCTYKQFTKGKKLKPKLTWDGYHEISITKNRKRKYTRVHRLVAKAFIHNVNNKPQINHINGNKLDNYYKNLEWCTCLENNKHANKTGLINYAKGEQLPHSILNEKQVKEIRKLYKTDKYKQIELAKKFNVGKNCIYHIIHNNTWKHIK